MQCSIDATGSPLTDEALSAAQAADAVLLGAIGGPKWGTGAVRPEQGLLRLRKEMRAYGNLRPCFFASDALVESSPLKAEVCRGTDFVIVRELTGGIYFGERQEDDGSGHAWDKEPYSREEIERVARLAGFLARGRGEKKVWSLDKANVLATSRLWRKVMTETFEREFPEMTVEHQLIDSAAMIMVKKPTALNGVVVTSNLFGDIISDEASVIPGSIGLLPSASLSGIPDGGRCNGIYEPIHGKHPKKKRRRKKKKAKKEENGRRREKQREQKRLVMRLANTCTDSDVGSAPDISGQGIVNPLGTILSVAMMLRYSLNLPDEAKAVEDAVKAAIDGGLRTKDMGGAAGTVEVGEEVVKQLVKILQG